MGLGNSVIHGFEKMDTDPKLISLIVAEEKAIWLTVYIGSHFDPDGCVLDYRLFAYGIHSKANSSGPAMYDAWVVSIPVLKDGEVVGSLYMHGFSVFRTPLDIESVLNKTKATILKTQCGWKNIQHGPEI
eukprot:2065613-Ditylum_brightwellii.AAC.1